MSTFYEQFVVQWTDGADDTQVDINEDSLYVLNITEVPLHKYANCDQLTEHLPYALHTK